MNHDLFQTPNQVELTITEVATPPSYAGYPEGKELAETMPMWRVQTEGYTTHAGQLIGVVSRNDGFLDSPDTEWISGGVNSKGPEAVAIGRHGNFLHWGFAASPTFLTEEAKDVFENAVHYIARFDGAAPIARKKSGTMMRSAVDRAIHGLSDEGYAETVARYEGYRADESSRKAAIRAREEAGETLTDGDRRILEMPLTEIPGRIEAARRLVAPEKMEALGHDPERVAAHLAAVRPYMRSEGWYQLVPDGDLMGLEIPNSDIGLLDAAIAMLGTDQASLGERLLGRYTDAGLTSKAAWQGWLNGNRERLFFTEAGGYRWLVDTTGGAALADTGDEAAGGAGPPVKKPGADSPKPAVRAAARDPFAAGLGVRALGEGHFEVTLEVDVFRGWHAYDEVPAGFAYRPLTHVLDLPDGAAQVGDWERPASHPSKESPELTVFQGRLLFRVEVEADDPSDLESMTCRVGYQVCDDRSCLPPSSLVLTATLEH